MGKQMHRFSPIFFNEKTQEWELVENEDRVVMVEFSNGKWIRYEEANRYKSAIEQLSYMLQSDDFSGLLKIVSNYVKEVNGKNEIMRRPVECKLHSMSIDGCCKFSKDQCEGYCGYRNDDEPVDQCKDCKFYYVYIGEINNER